MALLPLIVSQPFGNYKHGDRIDTEDAVMAALEHHPHFVVQVAGDVTPAAAKDVAPNGAEVETPAASDDAQSAPAEVVVAAKAKTSSTKNATK